MFILQGNCFSCGSAGESEGRSCLTTPSLRRDSFSRCFRISEFFQVVQHLQQKMLPADWIHQGDGRWSIVCQLLAQRFKVSVCLKRWNLQHTFASRGMTNKSSVGVCIVAIVTLPRVSCVDWMRLLCFVTLGFSQDYTPKLVSWSISYNWCFISSLVISCVAQNRWYHLSGVCVLPILKSDCLSSLDQ